MFFNSSVVCEIILLHRVSLIYVQHGAADDVVIGAAKSCDFSLSLRTEHCFDDAHHRTVSGSVLLAASVLPDFDYLALQQTCYPSAGVWCIIRESFSGVVANLSVCDIFLLVEEPPITRYVISEVNGVIIFTWTPSENVCNKAGVFVREAGGFKTDFNGLAMRKMTDYFPIENDAYIGKPVPAKKLAPSRSGTVQGFEYSLMKDVEQHLNFTIVDVFARDGALQYGLQPVPENYWDVRIIGYLVRREVLFCYGDLSVMFLRSLFVDFTYTHDVDVAVFLAKVDVKLFTGGHLLQMIRGSVSACYMMCVIFLSFWLAIDRVGVPQCKSELQLWSQRMLFELIENLVFLASYVVHPTDNVALWSDVRRTSLFLIGIWKVSMLWLAIVFSSALISFVTHPTIVGECDTITEVTHTLRTVPRSRIYTWAGLKPVFLEGAQLEPKPRIKLILPYMEAYLDDDDVIDTWRFSRVSFIFGESILLRRGVWRHNMDDFAYQSAEHSYNAYQAIAFQKGCVLKTVMNSVVQRLVETGHLRHYKNSAGLHLDNRVRVPVAERPITLYSVTSVFLVVGISCGLCIVVLLAEIFDRYQLNRPTIPLQYYSLMSSIENAKNKDRLQEIHEPHEDV